MLYLPILQPQEILQGMEIGVLSAIAQKMESQLFLPRDYVIHQGFLRLFALLNFFFHPLFFFYLFFILY